MGERTKEKAVKKEGRGSQENPPVAKGQSEDRISAAPPGCTQQLLLRSSAMSCAVAEEALHTSRAGSTSPMEALSRPMRDKRAKASQSQLVSYTKCCMNDHAVVGSQQHRFIGTFDFCFGALWTISQPLLPAFGTVLFSSHRTALTEKFNRHHPEDHGVPR